MNDESRSLTYEDWGFFGLRWVLLITASLVFYLLHKDTGRTDLGGNILVTFFVGAVINITFLLLAYYPKFQKAVPVTILLGDLVLAGVYASLGFFEDPFLRLGIVSALVLTAAIRLSVIWSLVQTVGVIAVALTQLFMGQQIEAMLPLLAPQLTVLGGLAIIAVGLSFTHERAGEEKKQAGERMNRRAKNLVDNVRERNRVISDMAATWSATLNPDRVLEAALDAGQYGVQSTGRDKLVCAALLFRNDGALHVLTSRGFTRNDLVNVVPGKNGILGRALRECVPVFGKDGHRDPELQYFTAFQ